MQPKATTPPSREVLQEVHERLLAWKSGVDRSKKSPSHYIAAIGWKGTAALLQYNVALRTARLGAYLLGRSLDDRQEGLLFALTRRPMFESYTRGMWLEHVADESFAEQFLARSPRAPTCGIRPIQHILGRRDFAPTREPRRSPIRGSGSL